MSHTTWRCHENRADLRARLGGALDIHRPDLGLLNTTAEELPLRPHDQLLAIRFAEGQAPSESELEEVYVRETDLVIRYRETASRPFRLELYWRYREETWGFGCDLICSVQTSLLDCTPWLAVGCRHPGTSLWQMHAESHRSETCERGEVEAPSVGLLLVPGATQRHALALAVFPSDFQGVRSRWSEEQEVELEFPLFGEWMEKGVIRRAQMRLAFVDQGTAMAAARAAWHDFLGSPLPLTT